MSVRTIIRSLAPSEESFTFSTGLYVGYGSEVVGELDPTALQQALEALSESYPLLRTHLDGDETGHVMIEGGAPAVVVHDAEIGDDVLEGLSIRQDQAVAGVYWRRSSSRAVVGSRFFIASSSEATLDVLSAAALSVGQPASVRKVVGDRGRTAGPSSVCPANGS